MINSYYGKPARGTGGAGIGGLIAGMQAGQQFGNNEKKMEMLQKNFDDQQDVIGRDKLFESMYDADDRGDNDYSASNKILEEYPRLGGGRFEASPITTGNNMDGTPNNKFINQYRDQTGEDYVEGEKLQQFVNADGTRQFFNDQTFSAGSSGYRSFREKKQLANDLLMAKINKAKGGSGDKNIDKVAELIKVQDKMFDPEYSPTADDRRNYNTYSDLNNVTKPNAVRLLNSSEDFKAVNKSIDNDDDLSQIDQSLVDQIDLAQDQSGNAMSATTRKPFDDDIGTYETLTDLNNQVVDLIKNKGSAEGTLKNALVDAGKYLSTDEFKKLKPEEQRQFLQTISLRSGLGMAGSQILQAISGAAVSEEEYNRMMNNIMGGNVDKINFPTIQAALQGSSDIVKNRVNSRIKGVPRRQLGSKLRYARRMDSISQPKKYEVTKGGNETLKDAPGTVVTKTFKDIKDAGSNIIDAMTGKDKEPQKPNLTKGAENVENYQKEVDNYTPKQLMAITDDELDAMDAPQRRTVKKARRKNRKKAPKSGYTQMRYE